MENKINTPAKIILIEEESGLLKIFAKILKKYPA